MRLLFITCVIYEEVCARLLYLICCVLL